VPSAKQDDKQTGLQLASGTAKSYFSVLATIILLIVLIILIYPAIQHITRLNREISDARLVQQSLKTKLDNLTLAKANLDEVRADLPILDLALPIGSDFTPYLKKIERMVKKSKLEIAAVQFTDVQLSKPKSEENLQSKKLSYTITLEGSFPRFRTFLKSLEEFIRTSDVTTVSISKDDEGVLLHTLNVSSYYLDIKFIPSAVIQNQNTSIDTSQPEEINE
jgi:Tfp pilus assembly protein PilO